MWRHRLFQCSKLWFADGGCGEPLTPVFEQLAFAVQRSYVYEIRKYLSRASVLVDHLREDRFGIEPELTAKIAAGGWRVHEVPVSYRPRAIAQGKKIGWRDGMRAFVCIVRYSGRPSRGARDGKSMF